MSSPEIEAARERVTGVVADAWDRSAYVSPVDVDRVVAALEAAIRADTLRNDPIVKGLVEALRPFGGWQVNAAIAAYEEATRE